MRAISKDFWREIRHTRSRFASILILVALAVAFLSGLRATAPDMKDTCDSYLDSRSFMDIQVMATLGLTEEDLDTLCTQEGIASGEACWVIDAFAQAPGLEVVVKVHSLPQELNLPTLTAGRMPEKANECVVEEHLLDLLNLELGGTLDLATSGDYADALTGTTFTVVGTVVSPLYISAERGTSTLGTGQVSTYLYLPREAFALDYYTTFYLTVEGAGDETAFSPEYDDLVDGVVDALEPVGKERSQLRRESLVDEANEKLDEAQQELDEAKAEAEEELSDAEQELADARKELSDGWAELADAEITLEQETADAEQELSDGEQELADALVELNDGEAEYADGKAEYQDGLRDYQDGLAEYEENKEKVEEGWEEYEDGYRQYLDGKEGLADAYHQLRNGEAEYADGKAQLDGFVESYLLTRSSLSGYGSSDALGSALMRGDSNAYSAVNSALGEIGLEIQELQEAVSQLDRLEAAQSQLSQGVSQAQDQVTVLEGQVAELQEQLENPALSPEEQAALTEQLAQAQEGLSQAQESLKGLQADLGAAEAGLAIIDKQLADRGMDRRGARAALDTLESAQDQMPGSADALAENYQLLRRSKAELESGWAEYYDGLEQLQDAKEELDDAKAELEDADEQLADGWEELEDARRQLEEAETELVDGRAELDDGWREYYDGLQELSDGREELKTKVADAQAEIADGRRELQDGEAEYADGYQEYLEGKAEAEEKIADAEKELADARRKIADIGDSDWYILSRDSNPGYLGFGQDADRMANLASVFPVLFFLVAALVCLTTMTRMVEEQRVQIGSLKALGYTRWTISRKYLGYGLLPALAGGLLGLAIGFTLFPKMIFTAYQIMYDVPDIILSVYPTIALGSLGAAVACTTVPTLAACLSSLRESPAALMRPRAPKAGKRVLLEYIRPLWRRMSFNYKVTARNLLRYQKRFWMTVAGIGGCTALIIAGFGLRSSLLTTMDVQYQEIYHYDAQVAVADNLLDSEREAIDDFFREDADVTAALPCGLTSVTAESDTYSTTAYLQTVDPEALGDFVTLRTMDGGEAITVPDDGAVIDQKLSELLDIGPGDTFTVDGESRAEIRVAAVTEHYLGHFIYLSPAYYETVFGEAHTENAYLVDLADNSQESCDAVFAKLMDLSGVVSATRMLSTRDTYQNSMERIDFVVVIVILSAAALAMVVLYNLSNINITERRRELATIRVLGFYDREVSAYVNRENVVLTIFGILFGILLGHVLHVWLVRSVEIDLMMFGRDTDPMAYLWAALLTAAFSAAVSLLSHRKMQHIDMVESLKSAE